MNCTPLYVIASTTRLHTRNLRVRSWDLIPRASFQYKFNRCRAPKRAEGNFGIFSYLESNTKILYYKKNKSKENIVTEGYKLEEVQQNAEILRKYLSSISMETLRTLLCFYEMGNSNLAVEKLEDTYKYIVDSAFDEMYIIRKLKQKNTCLRIIVGMKKCGQVTYEKQLQAALEEEKVEL